MSRQHVPIETFARDLWEAMREDARDQLGSSVTEDAFDQHVPPWEQLSPETRASKITIAREELLKILDRAGYVVVKKKVKST